MVITCKNCIFLSYLFYRSVHVLYTGESMCNQKAHLPVVDSPRKTEIKTH